MTKGLFVVCEGLDATGKTTTIKKAMEYLPNTVYSKGLCTDTPVGRLAREQRSTYAFSLELLYVDKHIVRPSLAAQRVVLQDRWYDTVYSHNFPNELDRIMEQTTVPHLTRPDVLVYFSASLEERLKRIKERGNRKTAETLDLLAYLTQDTGEKLRLLNELEGFRHPMEMIEREARMMKRYKAFPGPRYIMDTTGRAVEDSARELSTIVLANM